MQTGADRAEGVYCCLLLFYFLLKKGDLFKASNNSASLQLHRDYISLMGQETQSDSLETHQQFHQDYLNQSVRNSTPELLVQKNVCTVHTSEVGK